MYSVALKEITTFLRTEYSGGFMKTIHVNTSHPYDVIIERDGIKKSGKYIRKITGASKAAVITDDIVGALYGKIVTDSLEKNGFECSTFTFPNGEQSKNLSVFGEILDFLCENSITRSDIIIALGGGVVGDITGFASASYLRGVDFVQIPTTLLAQIDSSVGGKTAIDIKGGKNLAGAFKQPALVICDSNTLKTLTPEILSDGMAEAVKYGMIRDKNLFELINNHTSATIHEAMDDLIYTCIDIKRDVVEHDEFDKGERMILNFGHTLGHALEGWHEYTNFTHGMGVSAGMCMITEKLCSTEIHEKLKNCLEKYSLPTGTDIPINELLPFCYKDKKRTSGSLSYIVCKTIGSAEIVKVTIEEFCRLMEE